ncbi:MAG TPA: hypothetical protein VF478_10125 [Anaerolineae bacterium]
MKTPFAFLLFFVVGIALARESLSYSWFYDDLHLIRVYSPDELVQSFRGTWDVDGIETPGYRPLTTLFNHVRAVAFGENTAAHRIFDIALFSAFLTVFSLVAVRLGMPYPASLLAGVLTLCARYNWVDLVWIADGVHAFQGLLAAIASLSLLSYLNKRASWKIASCVIWAALALLVREDSVALIALIPILGLFYLFQTSGLDRIRPMDLGSSFRKLDRATRERLRALVAVTMTLLIVCLIAALLRFALVGESTPLDAFGWFTLLKFSLFPMGLPSQFLGDVGLHDFWAFTLGLAAMSTLLLLNSKARSLAFLWICCTVVATAPGVVVQRNNLLTFPILFYSSYLALVAYQIARLSNWAKAIVFVILSIFVLANSTRSLLAQEAVNPTSLEYVSKAHAIIQNSKASVPPERAARLWTEWAKWGIHSEADYETSFPLLQSDALARDRRHPDIDGNPFAPIIPVFSP